MKAPDESGQHIEAGSQTSSISQLAPPGVVLLASICSTSTEGLTRIRLINTETELMALSSQAFGPADLNKTVACIGVQASDALMIIGTVPTGGISPSLIPPQANMLNQLLEDFQVPDGDELVFEHDGAAELEGMPGKDIEEEVLIEAGRKLTIKCGASSITLSADGRVNIRGKFVTNSASQLNRISGGSVKIN